MKQQFRTRYWWLLALSAILGTGGVVRQIEPPEAGRASAATDKKDILAAAQTERARTRVIVVAPRKGGLERTTTQPGTIEAFEFADLYAKVSGFLKKQDVDIGDTVTAGQDLAWIDAPEFQQELKHAEAALEQARAQVKQMEARVATAKADFEAATANIKLAEAELIKATANLGFRTKQYERIKRLFELKSVDERLVDEKDEQREAAQAAQHSARAGILAASAQASAAEAKIAQAKADVLDAEAKVQVAESMVARARVFVEYTRIVSPYNGVVTQRSFHVGDFIRAAEQGGTTPVLTVARTDKMRVIVKVPERDVPFTDPGDPAVVELDAIPGLKFTGKVARISNSEDRISRSMRTEVDLKNTENQLRDGMFGRVTIILRKAGKGFTIPSSSLVSGKSKKVSVFVVRDGKVHLRPVEVGQDDGIRAEILSGLSADDRVVARPGSDLSDGMAVEADEVPETAAEKPGHG
jgi:RND family efflux transporter MFP subunit